MQSSAAHGMPSYKNVSNSANIDWYLISIDRLKRIGLAVLIAAVAIGSYLYWTQQKKNPRLLAERAVQNAQEALDTLAASKEFNNFRSDYDRAHKSFDQARLEFGRENWLEARSTAEDALAITKLALDRIPGQRDSDAQFLTVEGQVLYQKGGGDWKPAEVKTPLFSGDWVKTSPNSSAELMFANGSLYTIGPNALLEIYALQNPGSPDKQNSVTMQVGSLEIATHDDSSTIRTSGAQVLVDSQSTAQVGVDDRKGTEVVNLRGGSQVTSAASGTSVRLGAGETVAATGEGTLSDVTKVISPPALQAPGDNQVYQASPKLRVTMEWSDVESARGYQLQVSRSRLFTTQEINELRSASRAVAEVSSEGVFYWRVASIDAKGKRGPFSDFRRFRIAGIGSSLENLEADKSPPALQVKRPFPIGGQFYLIEGKVEPGASVFINDDEVTDIASDGTFKKLVGLGKVGWNTVVVKAVDLAGNQAIQREKVYAEE
jgi:hypothetical protein